MWNITCLRLRRNRRGASNVIVVVLSLVIIVAIVSSIVLWSYEMNQLDWEKMKEDMNITNVERVSRSSWSVTQSEYAVNMGSNVSGTYEDTHVVDDGSYSTLREAPNPPTYRLDVNGTFLLDLSAYPLESISTVEIRLRYNASDAVEEWFLKAYNWTAQAYSDNGFNSTVGHTPTGEWSDYAINLTNKWQSYVRDDGAIYVKFSDEGNDTVQTTIDIDFLGVRAVASGTRFTFKNEGPLTSHLVSLWIINSTNHQRFDVNIFVNSAETTTYLRADINLPAVQYTVKVVTKRGNTAVYSGS